MFINNYIGYDKPCLQHCWYLAVDFQLYIISVAVLLLIWKYPQLKRIVLGTLFALTIVIVAVVTYSNKFDGMFMILPESEKYAFWYDKMYRHIYIPTHTNGGAYITGIIVGFLYHHLKDKQIDLSRYKVRHSYSIVL